MNSIRHAFRRIKQQMNVRHVQRSDLCHERLVIRPHMCLHPVHYMRGIEIFLCSQKLNVIFMRFNWDSLKKNHLPRECFLLILCVTHGHLLFSCRLQQQRSEDGMQKTWAQCQLQRAGLAGSEHFIIILSPNTHLWYCKSSQSISLGLVWYSNQCLLTAR